MTVKTHSQKQARHDAFLIRKGIFFVGVHVGLLFGYFLSDWVLGLASYFVAVTVADAVVHYGLGKRSSVFVSQKNLATNEQISPVDLDRYHDSRRTIRFVALGVSGLTLIALQPPETFCGAYVAVTIVSVLYAKFALNISGPSLKVKRLNTTERCSKIVSAEMTYGAATGVGKYGILHRD